MGRPHKGIEIHSSAGITQRIGRAQAWCANNWPDATENQIYRLAMFIATTEQAYLDGFIRELEKRYKTQRAAKGSGVPSSQQ